MITEYPTTEQSIAALTEGLRLTVPLHIRELQAHLASLPRCFDRTEVLTNIAARCAKEFSHRGDMMQFRLPSRAHRVAAQTAGMGLSQSIAAACLLNPAEGVEVFGAHFCAHPHADCPRPAPESSRRAREYLAAFHAVLDDYEALLREAA